MPALPYDNLPWGLSSLFLEFLQELDDLALAFLKKLSLVWIERPQQGEELTHVYLLLIADVGDYLLGDRVIRRHDVGVVDIDRFQLARDVQPDGLYQLFLMRVDTCLSWRPPFSRGETAGNDECQRWKQPSRPNWG